MMAKSEAKPTRSVADIKKDLDRESKRIVRAGERKLSKEYTDLQDELKKAQEQALPKVSQLHTEGHLGAKEEPAPSKDEKVSARMNLDSPT